MSPNLYIDVDGTLIDKELKEIAEKL